MFYEDGDTLNETQWEKAALSLLLKVEVWKTFDSTFKELLKSLRLYR